MFDPGEGHGADLFGRSVKATLHNLPGHGDVIEHVCLHLKEFSIDLQIESMHAEGWSASQI